jgi:hypothetical protein
MQPDIIEERQRARFMAKTSRAPSGPNGKETPMSNGKKMMQIVAVIERNSGEGKEKKSFWTRIGVAFENKDGSFNLLFDYLPADMQNTTIQLREKDAKDTKQAAE